MALEMIARDINEAPALVVWLLIPSVLVGALWLAHRRWNGGRAPRALTVSTTVALGALTLQLVAWVAYYAVPLENPGVRGIVPWVVLPTFIGLMAVAWATISQVRASATASRTR